MPVRDGESGEDRAASGSTDPSNNRRTISLVDSAILNCQDLQGTRSKVDDRHTFTLTLSRSSPAYRFYINSIGGVVWLD